MNRKQFFAPWHEIRLKLRGTNTEVLEVLMYFFERTIAILLSAFVVAVAVFNRWNVGSALLFAVSWLGGLYLICLLLFTLFKPKK
jgi:hypothetical protein